LFGVRRKLIVVSNRGPLSYHRGEDGQRVVRRGVGGLVTALRGLLAPHEVTWIASAMSEEDHVAAEEQGGEPIEEVLDGGATFKLRLVAHEPVAYDRYYNVVANGAFWFLQHYLWGLASVPDIGPAFRTAWSEGYETVNAAFAEAVCGELERDPDTAVCFHDYHLYLAPALVRRRFPRARMTHFIHIPWPQADYWHALPEDVRYAVHDGLCANDLVGFHTERWRRNFLQACEAITGSEARTHAAVYPIAIDPSEFEALREDANVLELERHIADSRPELLVVRVDRTDPSKNVVRGFRAYALLLERHPELIERVGMLALLNPSREGLPEYAEYLGAIEREARVVNDRYATERWQPIELHIGDNFLRAVAAYKQFDVLLVNPIFDGMNLVAKEAPLVNGRDGVLVLSENAGAHAELGAWALTINPFDVEGQAEALHEALVMPADERRRRADAITAHVREHDVEAWTEAQLADLDRLADPVASRG
jgi:trehalose 6-phosphate synthase